MPGFRHKTLTLLLAATVSMNAGAAPADDPAQALAARACGALDARVDAVPGRGPLLLRSYDDEAGRGPSREPALAAAAFTYDNALATIALVACGRPAQAERIGAALAAAARSDSRLRNAYRAGAVEGAPLPNGWWDAAQRRWLEDGYQMGTATGNVAWTMLALLTLAEHDGDARWIDAARRLGAWVVANARSATGAGGFGGGVYGFDEHPQALTWKATEHNLDLAAAFARLARRDPAGPWGAQARAARAFVDAQWDAASGHFLTGTAPDGVTPNRSTSALDAQFWALLLPDAPPAWRRALAYAERVHGVAGGFDFSEDRDGVWVEGTAQGALAYRVVGRHDDAAHLLRSLAGDFSAGGLLYATPQARLSTGLALTPTSPTDDFRYYHWPHLGATAWAALAARGWNPYTGALVR